MTIPFRLRDGNLVVDQALTPRLLPFRERIAIRPLILRDRSGDLRPDRWSPRKMREFRANAAPFIDRSIRSAFAGRIEAIDFPEESAWH